MTANGELLLPWDSQGIPEVNWADPLTRGLKNALVFTGGGALDVAQQKLVAASAAFGAPSTIYRPSGEALYTPNGAAISLAIGEDWSGPCTIVWQCYINGADSPWGGLWGKAGSGGVSQLAVGRHNTTNNWYLARQASVVQMTGTSITGDSGRVSTFAYVIERADSAGWVYLYKDGALVQSAVYSFNQTTGPGSLYLGCETSPRATFDSDVYWLNFNRFDRVLSATELALLGNNPRGTLFQPRRIPISGTRRPAKRKTRDMLLPLDSQPQDVVGPDWGNPLTWGLYHLFDFRRQALSDLIQKGTGTPVGLSNVAQQGGIGVAINAGGYMTWPHTMPQPKSLTWFILVKITGTSSGFLLGSVQPAAAGYNHGLYINTLGFPTFFVKRDGVGESIVGTTNMAFGGYGLMVGTYSEAGQIRVYWNGKLENSTTLAAGTIDNAAFNIALNRWNGVAAEEGTAYMGGMYLDRVLSPAEVLELSSNPWQLFKPCAIPFNAGTPITTRREVSEILVPWESQPQELVSAKSDIVYVVNGGSGLVDLATGNMLTGVGSIIAGTGGLAVTSAAGVTTKSPSFMRTSNRKSFTIFGRSVNAAVYSAAGWNLALQDGYGWIFRCQDYGPSSTNFQLQAAWSAAYAINFNVPSSSLTRNAPFNFALTVNSVAGTWALYINGVQYTSSTLAATLDPFEAFGNPTVTFSQTINANYPHVVGIVEGNGAARAMELSANPWSAFQPRAIPFDQPALTRQLEPLTPTDGKTPRLYLT